VAGRYFQFLATFSTSENTSTPVLDNVRLKVNRVGFPNIRVKSDASRITTPINADTAIIPSITIENQPYVDGTTTYPALNANFTGDGGFFVDIYITPPGQTAKAPQLGDAGVVYAEVEKKNLPAGGTYLIPPEKWRLASCIGTSCAAVNWRTIFKEVGTYKVYVMADSAVNAASRPFGEVTETEGAKGTLGELDNVWSFNVVVQENTVTPTIFLPIIMKGTPAAGSQASTSPAATATALERPTTEP
jgi:hypothetical protein